MDAVTSFAFSASIEDIRRINKRYEKVIDRILCKLLLQHKYQQKKHQEVIRTENRPRRLAQALLRTTFSTINDKPLKYYEKGRKTRQPIPHKRKK